MHENQFVWAVVSFWPRAFMDFRFSPEDEAFRQEVRTFIDVEFPKSLQTRAVRDGDDYTINGQKIWTSNVQNAHFMGLLARTNPEAPKHRGISFFILDMKSPGVSVQPLVQMTGEAGFNQIFFEDVRVP